MKNLKSKTMNRTIKFRAIDLTLKIWVEGNLVQGLDLEGKPFCQIEIADVNQHRVYQVDPETVGQSTGLFDKNGIEIFENDLIELFGNKNGAFQVEFKNAYVGGWSLTSPISKDHLSLGARKIEELEIIGSIHQNPELLT
jgi:uncharacterized phage protein (TIGR01671 family)